MPTDSTGKLLSSPHPPRKKSRLRPVPSSTMPPPPPPSHTAIPVLSLPSSASTASLNARKTMHSSSRRLLSRMHAFSRPSQLPKSVRLACRNTSYLHVLLLPLLLLLFLEVPFEPPHTRRPLLAPLVRPGISVVACCMNRHSTLHTVLAYWQAVHNVSEILVVDWSSDPPLRDVVLPAALKDPRIKLVRVDREHQWVLSRAYNLAIRAASYDTILRTDCDYTLSPGFALAHPFDEQAPSFFAGNYQHARNENEVHLNGAVYIRRSHFLAVGGYDERIQTYGWDDEDLYTRLVESGLQKRNISYDHVTHVPHDDTARAQSDVKFVQVEIDLNSLLLKHLPKWNASAVPTDQWAIKLNEPRYAIITAVNRPKALKDLVPADKVLNAWNMALGQRLANDYQIPWDIMATMHVSAKRTLLTRLNARMAHRSASQPARVLFAHVMHGLGNRLRALASAMAFADSADRELVLIWETDAHISANFTDLFSDDMIVITNFKPSWPFKGYDHWDKSWLSFEFFNYMEMEGEGAVKGQQIVDKPDKHLYFKSAYIIEADAQLTNWDKDNKMLRKLTPVDAVRDMVADHAHHGLEHMIGVHIRDRTLDRDIRNVNFGQEYGDAASQEMEYWRRKSSYKTFMQEMRRLVRRDADVRFYVATDTVEVISKLEAVFGDKIVTTRRDCDGRDGRCARFALVDVLCLAKTKQLIGSNWSSFTEAASRFGGKAARLAGKDFAADADPTTTSSTSSSSSSSSPSSSSSSSSSSPSS